MDDAELLDAMGAASTAPTVAVAPSTLARLLVLAGYDRTAAYHAIVTDRREGVEVAGRDLLDLVMEARHHVASR